MKFLKKFCDWEKAQIKKPETLAAVGMAGGALIGFSQDNAGLGTALAIALGAGAYFAVKNK